MIGTNSSNNLLEEIVSKKYTTNWLETLDMKF